MKGGRRQLPSSVAGVLLLIHTFATCAAARAQEAKTPNPSPSGTITNRGIVAVPAASLPRIGDAYLPLAKQAIGRNWTWLLRNEPLDPKTDEASVRIEFTVDRQGHSHVVNATLQTGPQAFLKLAIQAIADTLLPPPPPAVLDPKTGSTKAYTISFILYGSPSDTAKTVRPASTPK